MSLIPVFTTVKAQLLAKVANAKPFTQAVTADNTLAFVQLWNNQLAAWLDVTKELAEKDIEAVVNLKNSTYSVSYPAILIEFDHIDMQQLGNGMQLYDDLIVRVHIVHEQLDAGDGTMEQNVDVYALADSVYAALQKFKPAQCVEFIRQKHILDWNHGNLYHYIIEFGTNYMDAQQAEPVGGITIPGGTITPVITEVYNPSPYIKV